MVPAQQDPHEAPTTGAVRLRHALGDPSLHVVLVAIGFLLALWPFVGTPGAGLAPVTAYLFAVWTAFVLALAGISRGRGGRAGSGSSDHA